MPDIHIKQFTLAKTNSFLRLRKEIERESEHLVLKGGERSSGVVRTAAALLLSQRKTIFLLAYDKKKMIGYVSLVFPRFKKMKGNAYLTIALKKEYRGQGIGTILMDKAEEYALGRGARRIELEVFAKNTGAKKLYETLGYVVEGIKKEAVTDIDGYDDIVIMAKKIKKA